MFELLSVALLAFGIVLEPGFSWGDVVGVALMLWMVLSITRRRSSSARRLFTSLFALGLLLMAYLMAQRMIHPSRLTGTMGLVGLANLLQLALLWSRPTSSWLKGPHQRASLSGTGA
jgi:hypothetical protein